MKQEVEPGALRPAVLFICWVHGPCAASWWIKPERGGVWILLLVAVEEDSVPAPPPSPVKVKMEGCCPITKERVAGQYVEPHFTELLQALGAAFLVGALTGARWSFCIFIFQKHSDSSRF